MSLRSLAGGRRLIATLAVACVALALEGCVTLLPKATPVQLYRFGAPAVATPPPPSLSPDGPARGVILAEVALPRSAAGDGLLTVDGDQVAYVGGARWVEPAAVLFQSDVQAAFAARARNVLLLDRGQTASAAGVLRLQVSRLETRYGQGATPVVVVRLRATLERPGGGAVLAKAFDVEQAAEADRVSAIVAAYDTAIGAALTQLVDWTDAAVPSLAPPAAGAPR